MLRDYRGRPDLHGQLLFMVVPNEVADDLRPSPGEVAPAVALVDLLGSADTRQRHLAAELLASAVRRIKPQFAVTVELRRLTPATEEGWATLLPSTAARCRRAHDACVLPQSLVLGQEVQGSDVSGSHHGEVASIEGGHVTDRHPFRSGNDRAVNGSQWEIVVDLDEFGDA